MRPYQEAALKKGAEAKGASVTLSGELTITETPIAKSSFRERRVPTHCDFCDTKLAPPPKTSGPTGYAWLGEDKAVCYACCGWLDIIDMMKAEVGDYAQSPFYYNERNRTVANWPGSLVMQVTGTGKKSRVPFDAWSGSYQQRIYFRGPLGTWWSGTYYHTQSSGELLRKVKRIKS